MSRYVVTGCAGFIGSHLARALVEVGCEVVGIDAFTDYYQRPLKEANVSALRDFDRFSLIEADLAEEALGPLLEGVAGVYHLAARPGVRASWGASFARYVRDNLIATERLLDAAARAGVRVILASSSSVYGNAVTYPTPEDTRPKPVSPYGVTKLGCEHLAAAYTAEAELDAVILRYFTVYGPRQRPDMAITRIVRALVDGTEFRMFGTGEQSRDFTYVEDAVAATIVAMKWAPRGAVYNVGGGTEASLREIVALLERLSGRQLAAAFEPTAAGDVRRTAADTGRIRRDLGWTPATGLEEGLETQLSWAAGLVQSRANER